MVFGQVQVGEVYAEPKKEAIQKEGKYMSETIDELMEPDMERVAA